MGKAVEQGSREAFGPKDLGPFSSRITPAMGKLISEWL